MAEGYEPAKVSSSTRKPNKSIYSEKEEIIAKIHRNR
jgi:hypothetical protein